MKGRFREGQRWLFIHDRVGSGRRGHNGHSLADRPALGPCENGGVHPDTARSLNNFAQLLQAQGNLIGARPLLERALGHTPNNAAASWAQEGAVLQSSVTWWDRLAPPPSGPSLRCRTSTALRSTARSSMRFMVPEGAYLSFARVAAIRLPRPDRGGGTVSRLQSRRILAVNAARRAQSVDTPRRT